MQTLKAPEFDYSTARADFKRVLDLAGDGRVVAVHRRGGGSFAVIDRSFLRGALGGLLGSPVEVVPEDGQWAILLPGLPVAAEHSDLEAALFEFIDALREYVQDWHDHLRHAPNHKDSAALVNFVDLCDDDELRAWITGE